MDYKNEDPVKNSVASVFPPQLIKEWEEINNLITSGGTPLYMCPICKSEESRHLYGLEFMKNKKNRCPHCCSYLKYPKEKR